MNFSSKILAFADDLKIFGSPGLCLQNDLIKCCEWASKNYMIINTEKCLVLHFGRKIFKYQYTLNASPLRSPEIFKDLGIFVDKDLKFNEHLKLVTGKSFKLINMIFRLFHIKTPELYINLYKIYILPIIFYGFNTFY